MYKFWVASVPCSAQGDIEHDAAAPMNILHSMCVGKILARCSVDGRIISECQKRTSTGIPDNQPSSSLHGGSRVNGLPPPGVQERPRGRRQGYLADERTLGLVWTLNWILLWIHTPPCTVSKILPIIIAAGRAQAEQWPGLRAMDNVQTHSIHSNSLIILLFTPVAMAR